MKKRIPQFILDDVAVLQRALPGRVKQVALFGSLVQDATNVPHDVDLAVFVQGVHLSSAASSIALLPLALPMRIASANGNYSEATEKTHCELDYHIVLLDTDHLNMTFLNINKGRLCLMIQITPDNEILEKWGAPYFKSFSRLPSG